MTIGTITWLVSREFAIYHGYRAVQFTRQDWSKANAETRGHMLDNLLATHQLIGKSRDEITHLLGPPDQEDHATRPTLFYNVGYRGYNPNAPFVFSYQLLIMLNQNGNVIAVEITD